METVDERALDDGQLHAGEPPIVGPGLNFAVAGHTDPGDRDDTTQTQPAHKLDDERQRSASSSEFWVEKAADLRELRRSASLPTLRGNTSPVTRLEIESKPTPACVPLASPADALVAMDMGAAAAEGHLAAGATFVPRPPPCTPRGSRTTGQPVLPVRSRAMVFDFDLTLIPCHTGGMPVPGQELASEQYLRDLRIHLADLVRADFDLFIVTRGDVHAVRAALGRCSDTSDPGCGLESWFRGVYGADQTHGDLPITRRAESFTGEDMRRIQSIASPEAWARLSRGKAAVAPPPKDNEQLYDAASSSPTDGQVLVGRENTALACASPLPLVTRSSSLRLHA